MLHLLGKLLSERYEKKWLYNLAKDLKVDSLSDVLVYVLSSQPLSQYEGRVKLATEMDIGLAKLKLGECVKKLSFTLDKGGWTFIIGLGIFTSINSSYFHLINLSYNLVKERYKLGKWSLTHRMSIGRYSASLNQGKAWLLQRKRFSRLHQRQLRLISTKTLQEGLLLFNFFKQLNSTGRGFILSRQVLDYDHKGEEPLQLES